MNDVGNDPRVVPQRGDFLNLPQRKLQRLKNYDYSQKNAYFITVCTQNRLNSPFDKKIWQKSYHDHIIRDESDYLRIWQYIEENPIKWDENQYYIKTNK